VIFDGPNGFGKTTIYDAVELVFTGEIRRYKDLKEKLIDGRQTFEENPFYHENVTGKDIVITIEFIKNDINYVLERVAVADEINGFIDFSIYKLFTKTEFKSDERVLVNNENAFLTELFGKNYNSNFQFLNYIEQEECLFLLKHSDKNRKTYIGHLFDLKEFEAKIEKIEEIKRKVDMLCGKTQKDELTSLNSEITSLKESASAGIIVTENIRLFENKDFEWDKVDLDINAINYQEIAGADGVLERLKKIFERKESVKQYQINSAANYLLENEVLVTRFFRFYSFLARKDEFRSLKIENESLQNLISQLNNLTSANLDRTIELNAYTFIPSEIKDSFIKAKEELQSNLQELSGLDTVYSDISASRNLLKEKLNLLKEAGNASGECILCGYDWGTIDELLNQLQLKSQKIKDINSDKSNRFNESFSSFKAGIVQDLIIFTTGRVTELVYDASFVDELLIIESNQFNDIIKAFDFLKVDYSKFLESNVQTISDADDSLGRFRTQISSLKKNIDEQVIESYFRDYLRLYFDNDTDKIEQLSLQKIEQKKKYLNYLWSISQNQLLQDKTLLLNNKTTTYDGAKLISAKLSALKNIYKGSLTKYQKIIIQDIEVIFHIYSGRIMQSFQGGTGLFIFSEKEGIRFQSNPIKTYDAVFSMSSGQLSALIISFTLALHKKYSQNKIILIDDPVQTMDELNLYGFIDLLRNEFCNNQIIMSTHEDMMSAFMRYKFKNYNLSEKRINLKSLLQISD
jgi:DNA repair exonuclease SbcCD ATPase subunit